MPAIANVCECVQAFEAWFKMVKDHDNFFRRAYDKKLTCMGLASVAALPPDTLPQSIAASFPLVCSHRALRFGC